MTALSVGAVQVEVDGQGPPVVFVHGLGATSNSFFPMLEAFVGRRCIRLDLPGSGRSPRPYETLTIPHMVAAVIEVLRTVAGAPAHLVAHSMGTLVAAHVAVEAPEQVKSLTLFGPIAEPADSARERLRTRAQAARREGMAPIAEAIAASGVSSNSRANPLLAAFLRESHMRQDVEGFAQSCEALAAAEGAEARLIRAPAYLATGDEDAIAPPSATQAFADRLKGARLKIFDRCGHWTPLERPKECGKLAADFIAAQDA